MNIDISGITVNATLLIQMVNFWIAYGVLRFFLFTPVYRELAIQKRKYDRMSQSIASAEEKLGSYREEQRAVWSACRDYCIRKRPELDRDTQVNPPRSLELHELDGADADALRAQVVTQLVGKLEKIDG